MAKFYDTLIAEYIKEPGARGLALDKLAENRFDYKMISFDEVTNKKKLNFEEVDLKDAAIYSGEDVYITNKIFIYQDEKNYKISENKIFTEIETPLLDVLTQMEITGVKINRDELKGIGILLEKEILELEKHIYEEVGEEFNIKSPKQVGEILFDKLLLPKGKKTKTGWSVSADVLGELSHEYPIAQKIVDYRHYTKLLSTYIEGLTDSLDENDFLHTSYNSTVTTTGRLSSTKPNLQNIPSSHGIAGEIRSAFVSRFYNGKIMAFDYSQVEVRLLAMMSADINLINAFKSGLDIHHTTAEFLFPDETTLTSSHRKIAKAVNFGVIYGISAFGLSKMIDIPMKEAKIYIDKFFESYPKVREYLDDTISSCEKNGYVETLFGRKRYIKGINDLNQIIKNSAKREAINMPIQGTSADIIKIAMIEVFNLLKNNKNLKSKMIMQVHDELVFDVYPGEEDFLEKNILEIMENILKKNIGSGFNLSLKKENLVELKVDFEIGNNWRELK